MNFDFTKEIVLQSADLLLRSMTAADAKNLEAVATADSDLVLYSPYQIHTAAALQKFVQDSLAERQRLFRYPLVIFDKKPGRYAGTTSFANVSNKDLRLEIGWTWIGKEFQRTGLNRNAKFLLLAYAFDVLGFERVEFKTDARNSASRTAIEKIGGQYEGALRSHTVMNDGFRRTTVYYSILKEEWSALKAGVFAGMSAIETGPGMPSVPPIRS